MYTVYREWYFPSLNDVTIDNKLYRSVTPFSIRNSTYNIWAQLKTSYLRYTKILQVTKLFTLLNWKRINKLRLSIDMIFQLNEYNTIHSLNRTGKKFKIRPDPDLESLSSVLWIHAGI